MDNSNKNLKILKRTNSQTYFEQNHLSVKSVGRRKTAITNLTLSAGSGHIFVNGMVMDEFFVGRPSRILLIQRPFRILTHLIFRADAKIDGGGFIRQAKSLQLALSRAIVIISPEVCHMFQENYFLTCDSRTKERRKYGLKKSRKASQFSKRSVFLY
jgi:small subunit ribosomal protein S9